jgi:ABC-type glutathione transport system ATPase component
MAPAAILVENLTVREGGKVACADLSFSVPPGSTQTILGRGVGPIALLRCLLGKSLPDSGRALVLGLDARRRWKLRGRRRLVAEGEDLYTALSRGRPPKVLFVDQPEAEALDAAMPLFRDLVAAGTAALITTKEAGVAARIGGRIGLLARGRLTVAPGFPDLLAGFRRLRYTSRMTETRTDFGTELDEFDAMRVRVRGWGVEAVVSNFTPAAFERLRALDGVEEASAEAMTLSEILDASADG